MIRDWGWGVGEQNSMKIHIFWILRKYRKFCILVTNLSSYICITMYIPTYMQLCLCSRTLFDKDLFIGIVLIFFVNQNKGKMKTLRTLDNKSSRLNKKGPVKTFNMYKVYDQCVIYEDLLLYIHHICIISCW